MTHLMTNPCTNLSCGCSYCGNDAIGDASGPRGRLEFNKRKSGTKAKNTC